jgi:Xaa-Pro aminopeptidase
MEVDYAARRQRLAQQLPANSIAIISAVLEARRNGDTEYRFCQDSDFYYLTGFNEPEALLLITSGEASESILFNRARVPAQEQWTGPRLGQEDAVSVLGVNAAFTYDSLETRLPQLLMGKEQIFYTVAAHSVHQALLLRIWQKLKTGARRGSTVPNTWVDLAPLLGEMRVIKQADEILLMREAARISVAAHQRAMRAVRHLRYEYELEAELVYEMTRQGCRATAYDSIVAGGARACTLHYTANNQPLVAGELVLVDAGGEFSHYAADITRTYPINGRFSPEQRAIYDLVLHAQRAGIAAVKPGQAWNNMQTVIVAILTQGLVDLGLLQGDVSELIAKEAYKPFYMHSSGHWLGLDVHDAGAYFINGTWRTLQPGMVLTVEPGLYIPAGLEGVDERWWGIGVRIEDDIHVTSEGPENLTAELARDVDEIEAYMNA